MTGRGIGKAAVSAIIIILILLLAVSCTERNGGNGTVTGSDSVAVPSDTGENRTDRSLEIKKTGGEFGVTVVRPDADDISSKSVKAAQKICTAFGNLTGSPCRLSSDSLPVGADNDDPEILVGVTSRKETAEALADCTYGDWTVRLVGKKIVVAAFDYDLLDDAADHLIKLMTAGYDGENEVITLHSDSLDTRITVDTRLGGLPVFEGGSSAVIYDAGLRTTGMSCDEVIVRGTAPDEYRQYKEKLAANGYTLYTENEMAGNLFSTFESDIFTVNAGYYKHDGSVRILIEPLAPRTGVEGDNKYAAVTTSQITMLGLEHKDSEGKQITNGLSMLIRLTDGRFIVIDGGYNRSTEAKLLIDAIKAQSAEYTDKPIIAAWIISHIHIDHFAMIGYNYPAFVSEGIRVERFLTNFISDSERNKSILSSEYGKNWRKTEGAEYVKIIEAAKAFGATLYKVHPGQVFFFADCRAEILYTLESSAPDTCNALNGTSPIIKMTFGGKTSFLCTGDATGKAFGILNAMYGDYIRSDIIQVAHHGYTTYGQETETAKAYRTANASIVLWPMGLSVFDTWKIKSYNSPLFVTKNFRKCYVAGAEGDSVTVALPYEAGKSSITEKRS